MLDSEMSIKIPDRPLGRDALRRLRSLVDKVAEESDGNALPLEELSALAGLPPEAGITIDFEAADELGHPLVVLRPNALPDVMKEISPREREVARLVADGLSNKDIADRLHISLGTVKDHVHRILEKTQCANRTKLALAVCSSGTVHGR